MNKYSKKIKPKNKYREFIRVINGNLHLTDRELEIFALLVQIDTEWKPLFEYDFKNINSTDNRRAVMKESRINRNNLTRYIKSFREREYLVENEQGGLIVNPLFIPKFDGDRATVIFDLDFSKDKENENELV